MGKINAVVADFESIHFPYSNESYIHTISCIPVSISTGKMSQYVIHTEKALVIKIIDVLNKKSIIEFLEALVTPNMSIKNMRMIEYFVIKTVFLFVVCVLKMPSRL